MKHGGQIFVSTLQVFDLYHFTDEVSKDLHQSRHWYAGWDFGRRLLFVLAHHFGIYLNISLLAVRDIALQTYAAHVT